MTDVLVHADEADAEEQAPQRELDLVDRHIGQRIRVRRGAMGISQVKLAKELNITFQQVQKYESGANRVSASRLFAVARILSVPIGYFVDGLDTGPFKASAKEAETQTILFTLLSTPYGLELASAFPRVESRAVRSQIARLVNMLAAAPGA